MITAEVATAYTQCKLKAYILLFSEKQGVPHEYVSILDNETRENRIAYINQLEKNMPEAAPYTPDGINKGNAVLVSAYLSVRDLHAYTDALVRKEYNGPKKRHVYSPTLVVGTYKINAEQKFHLAYIGYVLSLLTKTFPNSGVIVGRDGCVHRIRLETLYKAVDTIIADLRSWAKDSKRKPPDIILNRRCDYCPFQKECQQKAIEIDDLSLLRRITKKDIDNYQKKGIFTIKQLSFLFRPRKQRKRKNTRTQLRYRPELQALAIRTGKTYIQELPELNSYNIQLFLDIEGIPDQDFYYLIGLLIFNGKESVYVSLWADSAKEEELIWHDFLAKVDEYPEAPIYHYGMYDAKAIRNLKRRYGNDHNNVEERLVNVNSYIFGKIYFPVYTNTLKELGKFIGASWTHPAASGLQSLVWRFRWTERQDSEYRQLLLTYNEEDCRALCLLTAELFKIAENAESSTSVDFADQPKRHASDVGKQIHKDLESLLQYAHADYENNKITLQQEKSTSKDNACDSSTRISYGRLIQAPGKVVHVRPRRKCPRCKNKIIITEHTCETTITDLVFTKNGCRKSIVKYIGNKVYCSRCKELYTPRAIRFFEGRSFGHSFMAWTVYQRVVLRLPYEVITQTMEDMFTVRTAKSTVVNFVRHFATYYSSTEKLLIRRILESPFVHADETKINIQGYDHYVWVFTDGKHVVLRKTETRESKIVHEFLSDYSGILVTDFYTGYDSVKCGQQKCWSHLIRDINDDLWKEPFNEEFELFVLEVKSLIVPILQTVQKYGSKKRHLNKFKKSVEKFYKNSIESHVYKFDVTRKYQNRFDKYRKSLFVFLEEDGIPWNNNMAERAIRHLAVQRKISGTFYDSLVQEYLLLLGIAQSCKFQQKPFLKFMLSKQKDVDLYIAPKPHKYSRVHSKNMD